MIVYALFEGFQPDVSKLLMYMNNPLRLDFGVIAGVEKWSLWAGRHIEDMDVCLATVDLKGVHGELYNAIDIARDCMYCYVIGAKYNE